MGVWNFQSNLNKGELDPRLVGRIDLASYYNGVKTGENILTMPQGGAKTRPGMEYLGTGLGNGRIESFSFSTEQNYLLVFTALRLQIYKDGVLQTNINGSGFDYVVTTLTLAQIQEFDYIQSADTVIITHEDVAPLKITRTSDTDWTVTNLVLTNVPQYDFNDALSPTPVDEVQRITFSSKNEGDIYKLSLEGIQTDEISFAGDDATNEENIRRALQALFNTGATGISVATFTSLAAYDITFSGDSANSWDLLTGTAENAQSATFKIVTARQSAGTSRAEDTWSNTRGWPITCTFHEARLWFGGSTSRPSTLWGSKVNQFFDFDQGRALDDEGVTITLDTDQVNAIQAIFSNRTFQIFTTGAEFVVEQSPITPENVAAIPQGRLGSKRVRPVTLEGSTYYVQRTGKVINQFLFADEVKATQTRNISVLAPHLIKDPVQMYASRGTSSSDANYVYIVNADGTLTVFNTQIAEDVTAFTSWKTAGNIKSIAVVDNALYFLVERTINSATVYYIERENDLLNTDAATLGTGLSSDTLTGLSHLESENVIVKADGAVQASEVVTGGQITIGRTANTIEAGLEWTPIIKTMPVNIGLNNGPNAASKKRILRAALQLYESNGVIVNGQRVADKVIGQNQFNAPSPNTGLERIHLGGWSIEADITITRDTPMQFTILSIGLEVAV